MVTPRTLLTLGLGLLTLGPTVLSQGAASIAPASTGP